MPSLLHDPLQDPSTQIRLLALRPNRSQRIQISTWDLKDAPPFKAISYHWGPVWPVHSVIIGSQDIDVRPNCFAALWHARHHFVFNRGSAPHYFWIDSLCIDQTNIPEKNQQVQLMGRIFEKAESVLACVGGIEQYNKRFDLDEAAPRLQFLDQKYWSRLWIVQELYLARKIHVLYGCNRLTWSTVEELQAWSEPYKRDMPYLPRLIQFLMRSAKNGFPNMMLQEAMCMFSDFHCLDRMDHVYSLIGITDHNNAPGQPSVIQVDYSRSILSLARLVLSTCRRHPYEYFPAVKETLQALRIRGTDDEMEALLSYWQLSDDFSFIHLSGQAFPTTAVANLEKMVQVGDQFRNWISGSCRLRTGAQISKDEHGRLHADFELLVDHHNQIPKDVQFMANPLSNAVTSKIDVPAHGLPPNAKLLYHDTQVAAITSQRTQPGDWLIHSFLSPSHFIIARQYSGNIYRIVGQGLTLPGYRPPVDTSVIKDSGVSIITFGRRVANDREKSFTLMLSEEDAFALGARYAVPNSVSGIDASLGMVEMAVTHSALSSFVYSPPDIP